jgi:hypothetical protein
LKRCKIVISVNSLIAGADLVVWDRR